MLHLNKSAGRRFNVKAATRDLQVGGEAVMVRKRSFLTHVVGQRGRQSQESPRKKTEILKVPKCEGKKCCGLATKGGVRSAIEVVPSVAPDSARSGEGTGLLEATHRGEVTRGALFPPDCLPLHNQ